MFDHAPILLAAWNDVLEALGGLLFLLIWWAVSRVVEANKAGQAPGPKPAAPPQPQRQPVPPQQARPAAAMVRDQVEEFLRRAGQPAKPGPGRRPQPPARPAGEIEVLLSEVPAASERNPLAEPLRPLGQRVGQSAPTEKRRRSTRRPVAPKPQLGGSVAEHVAEHVGGAVRALGEHASQLGERVIQADEQFDVQLKAKFDHRLGTLASERDAGQQERLAAADTPARQIAAMLADPAGVRQAIVLSEILNRPSDRW
jgi:hypothetical protein